MAHSISHAEFKQVVKKLESVGFATNQSEVIVEVVAQVTESNLTETATKQDILILRDDINLVKTDVDSVKNEVSLLKNEVYSVKNEVGLLKKEVSLVKNEVNLVKNEVNLVKNEVNLVKSDIIVAKAELKAELIKWMIGLLFAQSTLMISVMALLKLMP